MNSNSKTNDLKKKWQDIKTKAKQQWNKLKNEDLDAIEGSYSQLVEKVGAAYELTKDEATKKVNDYLDKQGLSYLPEEAEAFKDKVAEKASETKDKLEEYLKDSCHKIKKYSENAEENLAQYIKSNPLKTVGIALIAGLLTGKLFSLRR